ncbi:hypothetical protein ACU686_07640 [Yinghuangia aomiensis]
MPGPPAAANAGNGRCSPGRSRERRCTAALTTRIRRRRARDVGDARPSSIGQGRGSPTTALALEAGNSTSSACAEVTASPKCAASRSREAHAR